MFAVIPLRGFDSAKTRLAAQMSGAERARLAAAVAGRVLGACASAGWDCAVVSSAPDVIAWAQDRATVVVPDPGLGLDAAAASGVAAAQGRAWAVVHGDLPLVTARDLAGIADAVADGATVLAPSRDGGTNLVAAIGSFPFAYGPASFVRHLGRAPGTSTKILTRVGLAVELDTPSDLAAVIARTDGRWLARFLS